MADARRKQGEGDEGEEGGQPQPGRNKGGQGKPKLGQGRDGQFDRMEQIREGYEDNGKPGQAQQGGKTGKQAGDQAGDQPGNRLNDRPGKRHGGRSTSPGDQLKGQESAGPDIKKVFSDAARKGFARQGWRDVYKEYSQVADDMLDQEQIPPGRRSVVRQYFELIRPRKGWGPR